MVVLLRPRLLSSAVVLFVACFAPQAARAQNYCPVNAFFDPATPTAVYASPASGLVDSAAPPCSVLGAACPLSMATGTCRQLGTDTASWRCVPDTAAYPLFWACDGGCDCPSFGATTPAVRNLSFSGGVCLCQYETDMRYCAPATPSVESFVPCHSAPGTSTMARVLVTWGAGDCDGDGVPNSCEPTTGCLPCAAPPSPTPACAAFPFMRPATCLARDAGTPVDAGSIAARDAGPASDAGGVDAAVPRLDAGVVEDMDAGAEVPPPVDGLAFRGGGGLACGVAAARSRAGHGAPLVASLVAVGALVVSRRGRRRR